MKLVFVNYTLNTIYFHAINCCLKLRNGPYPSVVLNQESANLITQRAIWTNIPKKKKTFFTLKIKITLRINISLNSKNISSYMQSNSRLMKKQATNAILLNIADRSKMKE